MNDEVNDRPDVTVKVLAESGLSVASTRRSWHEGAPRRPV
jgi:hypothetical protein